MKTGSSFSRARMKSGIRRSGEVAAADDVAGAHAGDADLLSGLLAKKERR
jgi:hypothetical protein